MSSQGDSQQSQDSMMTVMDENRREIIYFAFGSNLSTAQMLSRCPESVPIGLGYLQGWGWIINSRGYANIVKMADNNRAEPAPTTSTDGGVYGLLYLLPPADEDKLDRHEGVPWAYGKEHMSMLRVNDDRGKPLESPETVTALAYVDAQRTKGDLPRTEYVDRMERGIKEAVEEWGMDADYADSLSAWLRKGTQP
ncbi:hypothetical protein ACO1O0_008152 [Amphichorda felina]